MLFILPILDTHTYIQEQLIYTNSIALMVQLYNDKASWIAYQSTIFVTTENVGIWNEELDAENFYPAIVMQVADPNGEPWNDVMVDIYPNEGEMNTNVDDYRSIEKNSAIG